MGSAVRTVRTVPAGGWLLGAYVALLSVQLPLGTDLQLAPSDAFILLYVLVRGSRMRHVPAAWSVWHVAVVAALALGLVVGAFRTGELTQYALLQKAIGFVVLLVTYACVVDFARDWWRLCWLLRVFLGCLVVSVTASVLAFLLAVSGAPVLPVLNQPFPASRLSGTLLDANAFGGMVAVGLVLHLLTSTSAAPLLRGWWARLADVVLPVGLVLTFSRSAWIGVTIGLGAAVLLWPRLSGRALRRFVLPALLAGPVLVLVLLTLVPSVGMLITRPSQIESRLSIAGEAWDEFVAHPMVGMGLGAFTDKYGVIVHNTALWFLAEMGVVGLGALAGLVLSIVIRSVDAARLAPARVSALVAAVLVAHLTMLGVSLGIEALYQRQWWLVMAAAGSAFVLTHQQARPGPTDAVAATTGEGLHREDAR